MDLSIKKFFLQIWIYKKSKSTRTPLGSVRPVGPTGQTDRAPAGQVIELDPSDRSGLTANFDRQPH